MLQNSLEVIIHVSTFFTMHDLDHWIGTIILWYSVSISLFCSAPAQDVGGRVRTETPVVQRSLVKETTSDILHCENYLLISLQYIISFVLYPIPSNSGLKSGQLKGNSSHLCIIFVFHNASFQEIFIRGFLCFSLYV